MNPISETGLVFPNTKTLAGRLLRLPLRLIPRNAVVTVLRGINRGMKWRVGSSNHGCWLGTYETEKQDIIREVVKPGTSVMDIGANAGFYTLGLASLVGPKGEVWAFEPFPENVTNLLRHVEMNRLRNVFVVQAAISERNGLSGFAAGTSNAQGRLDDRAQHLVPTFTLDSLNTIPDVVKIDIEGGELAALRGAGALIAKRRTTWLVALDDRANNAACRAIFVNAGYEVRDIGNRDEIIAIPKPITQP